jgi:hypothetical protein
VRSTQKIHNVNPSLRRKGVKDERHRVRKVAVCSAKLAETLLPQDMKTSDAEQSSLVFPPEYHHHQHHYANCLQNREIKNDFHTDGKATHLRVKTGMITRCGSEGQFKNFLISTAAVGEKEARKAITKTLQGTFEY